MVSIRDLIMDEACIVFYVPLTVHNTYIYTITFQQLLKHGTQFQMFTLTFQQHFNKQTKTHYISTAAKTWYTISNVYTHISTTFKQTNKQKHITFQQLLKHGIQFQMFTLTFQQHFNKQTKTQYVHLQ